ncbi:MAG: hypothetical protein HY698_15685 [Deltaproteobacteria bacterium]|nr:hypothetical protein [Deltaproteobacteria bacterium]
MKTLGTGIKIAIGLSVGLMLGQGKADAADYSARRTLDAASRTSGLGRSSVELLSRAKGPGQDIVMKTILEKYRTSTGGVTTSGEYQIDQQATRTRISGSGWYLQVHGDGTMVRYRNIARLDAGARLGKPVVYRMTNDELEKRGRDFISRDLSGFIKLGQNETLVPFKTEYQVDGGQSASGGSATNLVVASTVVFSRTIDGLHVVGPGSKVAITFINDGTPVGFDFDWAPYARTGRKQEVLAVSKILERGKRFLPTGGTTKLQRFECGILDQGARRRDPSALLQSACYFHQMSTRVGDAARNRLNPADGLIRSAHADPIPAGLTVEPDLKWPQAMALCTSSTLCGKPTTGETPPNAAQ